MYIESPNQLFDLVFKKKKYLYLKNKSIFITGGSGFIGRWILRSIDYLNLKKKLNIKLVVLVRDKKKINYIKYLTKNTRLKIIKGNLLSFKFKKILVDHIFHLATERINESVESNLKVADTIINGTTRLIELSNYSKVQSFSYLSSGAVYGKNCKSNLGWREFDRSGPSVSEDFAIYGLSKKCAESLLINNLKNIKTINIFRAFSFGGSCFNSVNNFAYDHFIKSRISFSNIILKSDGKSIRNYMHPIDLSNWMFEGLKLKKINIINAGGETDISLKKLAKTIARFNYNNLPEVSVKFSPSNNFENYIPNLSKANSLGLSSKVSLEMQIEDSFNFYYNKMHDRKSNSI